MKQRSKMQLGNQNIRAVYGRAHKYKGSMQIINKLDTNSTILDLGSGERRLILPNIWNADASRNKYLDVILDAHQLPFKDNIFDLIICEHLLEHVKKPWIVIEEIFRVCKKGGIIYIEVPFMTPYHGRPNHYFNMTKHGLEQLCEKFEKIKSGVQPYNMPSHTIVLIFSRYIRCFFPSIDNSAQKIEMYDTGSIVKNNSAFASILVKLYTIVQNILGIFDKCIDEKKAEDIAVATYFIGKKPENCK